jgi:hypothetical protein
MNRFLVFSVSFGFNCLAPLDRRNDRRPYCLPMAALRRARAFFPTEFVFPMPCASV